jgi:hypothetical protein
MMPVVVPGPLNPTTTMIAERIASALHSTCLSRRGFEAGPTA